MAGEPYVVSMTSCVAGLSYWGEVLALDKALLRHTVSTKRFFLTCTVHVHTNFDR